MSDKSMTIILGPDDMPTCPKHGIRVITDFFKGDGGPDFEVGTCPLCKRLYRFEIVDKVNSIAG